MGSVLRSLFMLSPGVTDRLFSVIMALQGPFHSRLSNISRNVLHVLFVRFAVVELLFYG